MKPRWFNRSRLLLLLLLAAGTAWAGNLKESVQTKLDANPFIAQQQLKLRVVQEHGGGITLELSEGPKTLRDLFRKGIEINGAGMREAALNEDDLKSLQCIRRTLQVIRGIKGVKEISLTGTINPMDLAENDYNQACQQLAQGSGSDHDEGVALLKKAAEAGFPAAQTDLAGLYILGLNAEPDEQKAVQWYRKAAEQGEARAQFNLGRMIAIGRGMPQDFEEAIQWYRKAAAQSRQLTAKIKSLNALALLLATCPQEKLRDGKAALELAQQAQHLDPQNVAALEALAAAYAQNGQFPEAVEQQEKWIKYLQAAASRDSSGVEAKLAKASKRLELYKNNQLDIEPVETSADADNR
jgi:TPR repeat protein